VAGALLLLCVLVLTAPAAAFHGMPGATPGSGVSVDEAVAQITGADGVLRFDVAENGALFTWSGTPELVDGFPTVGTAYVTQGYIYPAGTLDASNGVLEDGSPEFPDQVIGHWSCYGWWLGDAAHAATSPPWLNTHLFNFGPAWCGAMLTSEGYSIDDLDVPLERALTGGSGQFANASGVQVETNLGFNASGGMNFRYEIHVTES
jgi:hypothetical protein